MMWVSNSLRVKPVDILRTPITASKVAKTFDNKGKTPNDRQDVLKILSQSSYLFTWAAHSGLPIKKSRREAAGRVYRS